MDAIINEHTITIPPYISTSWSEIAALYLKEGGLVINLLDGDSITIPSLGSDEVEKIFTLHAQHLELAAKLEKEEKQKTTTQELPFRLAFGPISAENFGTAMQHNPEQMNAPDLPDEVLEQVSSLAKKILPDDPEAIPKAEPHCNCFFCQLARVIHKGMDENSTVIESEEIDLVPDEELQFRQWDIEETGDQLFTIKSRLDPHEEYKVSLKPVGCTCGNDKCEHIEAVLRHDP